MKKTVISGLIAVALIVSAAFVRADKPSLSEAPVAAAGYTHSYGYVANLYSFYSVVDGVLHRQDSYLMLGGHSYVWRVRYVENGQIVIWTSPKWTKVGDGHILSQPYDVNAPFELLEVLP